MTRPSHNFVAPNILAENNLMTGRIPEELGNLKKLEKLDLGTYYTFFASTTEMLDSETLIPFSLNQTENYVKYLDGNTFNGSLPTEIGGLERIVKIEIGTYNTQPRQCIYWVFIESVESRKSSNSPHHCIWNFVLCGRCM